MEKSGQSQSVLLVPLRPLASIPAVFSAAVKGEGPKRVWASRERSSEKQPNTSLPAQPLQKRQKNKSSLEDKIKLFFSLLVSEWMKRDKQAQADKMAGSQSFLLKADWQVDLARTCPVVKTQAALLASSVWKDKKDQLPALIASELNQQALCANSSGKIQIHENIITVWCTVCFFTSVTMQVHAH